MSNDKLLISIYTRRDCHLCEEMLFGLKKWQEQYSFDIELVDIDRDQDLTRQFAARIPVLVVGDTELCQYFLDEPALKAYFETDNSQ